ncbi:hypothetical protein AWENTII_000462 [Aspergillus wentii]
MDGDNRRMKQHDLSSFATRLGMSRAPRAPRAGLQQSTRGGDSTGLSQEAAGRPRIHNYMDYGYTDTTPFQGASLQGDEMQPYPPDFARPQQPLREQQRQPQQPFAPYESEMVYSLNQQGPAQGPYEVVSQYPSRQSAAIDALSNQFAVPQYFPAGGPTGSGVSDVVSPYLTPQLSSAAYNQPGPIGRSSAAQPFPANMADFTPVGATGRLEQQQPPAPSQQQQQVEQVAATSESTNVSETYGQLQRALRGIFDDTRAARLVEASRSLLEISEWLVTNARELGMFFCLSVCSQKSPP